MKGFFQKLFFGKELMAVEWLVGLGMKSDNQGRAVLS